MRSNHKDEQEKKIRRLWQEYKESWDAIRERGKWVDVEPYQRGWIRNFDLRDDIKNRKDASDIRRALHLINNQRFCKEEDFLEWDYRTNKMVPMKQELGKLTVEQYNNLDEKLKSFFSKYPFVQTYYFPYHRQVVVEKYVFKNDFWFVFNVEPNIIVKHWIPDGDAESRHAELANKIQRNNLWPKINKVLGVSTHYKEFDSPWFQNKYGMNITQDEMEYRLDEAVNE